MCTSGDGRSAAYGPCRLKFLSDPQLDTLTLNIPAYLPPYSYRGWTNLSTNCIGTWQWVPWQKKCKANIPSTSKLEHILFLHSPWKNFLSTLKVPLNFSNFHYRHIMRDIAFLCFLRFLAPKMLKSKNKGDLPEVFFNSKQLLLYERFL